MFRRTAEHLRDMALFAVNTGCRDAEVCSLRWDWEVDVPAMATSVFIVPGSRVKNGEERLVVLNRWRASVVDRATRPQSRMSSPIMVRRSIAC